MPVSSEANVREYIRRVCAAMDFISTRLADNPTLDEIAEASAFSKYHFHRVFKSVAGEGVAEFTRRLRLERAAQYLLFDATREITDIAFAVGFSSSQNFATAFRRRFGESPSEFRAARVEQPGKHSNADRKDSNATADATLYLSNWMNSQPSFDERNATMNVEVRDLPALHVAYARQVGPYGPENVGKAFSRLMQWAGPRGFAMGGKVLGICWDNPDVTPAERLRYDACVTVPAGAETSGDVGTQTIPAGATAVFQTEIDCDKFADAWNQLVGEWLPQSGYQPDDRPAYEVYLNPMERDPQAKRRVELCLPVRPL